MTSDIDISTERPPTATHGLTARVITLTPEMAEQMLGRNPRNRKASRVNYQAVRRAIERGEWLLNGEAIKVSVNGYILDGQHRCMAVRDTGISIETLLIEGLPDDTQDTMDTGKARSLSDILTIHGEANGIAMAALIKAHRRNEIWGIKAGVATGSGGALTNRECLDWLDRNPWVREYVHPGRHVARYTPLGSAVAGFLIRVFEDIDPEDSRFFWGRVVDGANLAVNHPIHALLRAYKAINESKGQRDQRYVAALTIKAWNAFRAGDEISVLRFRPGGANPEAFPEPK